MLRELISNYPNISKILKEYSYQEILQQASEELGVGPADLEEFPMGGYSKGKRSGAYRYVLQDLIRNVGYYDWLYERLEDEMSVRVFTNLMQYRMVPDMVYIEQAFDEHHHQYFDKEIVTCSKDEVFVDCGGFTGDTTEAYIAQYKNYKKIYVYEPSSDNILSCRKNLEKYPGIEVRGCGVGEKHAVMPMSNSGSSSSFVGNSIDGGGIEIVSLDEDISEKVTFIKMDVEGFEIPALIGAKNHIKNDRPKLAICTYHIISDMWEIPKLIDCIRPGYKFYLRHYMRTQNWETVLYAIPDRVPSRKEGHLDSRIGKRKRVVAMAPYERGWSNVELIKDCGLIPYLLYKNHGCDVMMVGAKGGDYPYLETCVQGVGMKFLANGSEEEKLRYIEENAAGIDCLLVRGCYPSNFRITERYRQLNPEGRIYVGLDANSAWMDRIVWDHKDFVSFMDCCDVVATSCRAMQEHLNWKWPWKIEHIANGYYDFQKKDAYALEKKRDVIFTAGRIGAEQKGTNVLLEAFARIAGEIPGWELHLAGTIEKGFESYLEQYFSFFPELRERIRFLGLVQDREILRKEYLEAKIFALPSLCEGGTPNVVAEALNAGCIMAVARIDAYDEAINGGKCGMAAGINDIPGFGQILLQLCKDEDWAKLSRNAYEYGRSHFNMERIVARLNEMLFGGR